MSDSRSFHLTENKGQISDGFGDNHEEICVIHCCDDKLSFNRKSGPAGETRTFQFYGKQACTYPFPNIHVMSNYRVLVLASNHSR